jgi:hypothetical protein
MSVLSDRFREVTVTLNGPASLPQAPPAAWLQPEAADSVVRFVHSDCQGEATAQDLAAKFPEARDISMTRMSLRAIFLAVAKAGRSHGESSADSGLAAMAQRRTQA